MLYKVNHGTMEEYPDDSLSVPEGATLAGNGFFPTKAEAKAFRMTELKSQIRSHDVIVNNLKRHMDATAQLAE